MLTNTVLQSGTCRYLQWLLLEQGWQEEAEHTRYALLLVRAAHGADTDSVRGELQSFLHKSALYDPAGVLAEIQETAPHLLAEQVSLLGSLACCSGEGSSTEVVEGGVGRLCCGGGKGGTKRLYASSPCESSSPLLCTFHHSSACVSLILSTFPKHPSCVYLPCQETSNVHAPHFFEFLGVQRGGGHRGC